MKGAAPRPAPPRKNKFRGLGPSGFHELHYLEWGRRHSPRTVVCVHGYSGNAHDFDYLARELSRDARVIALDLPGRGESAWLSSPFEYHFAQFLADIHALLARLKLKQVDWVGTSMGGLLGMLLAAKPSSPVGRLVMNDVGAFLPMRALQHIARNLEAPESFATLEELEAHLRRTHREWGEITDAQWRHLARHHARKAGGAWRLHYDPVIARVTRPMPFTPGLFFWDAWYRVRCPVLLLRGERSEVFPADVARAMVEVKPEARLVEVAGCGHAPALMSARQIGLVGGFVLGVASSLSSADEDLRDAPRQRFHPPRAA